MLNEEVILGATTAIKLGILMTFVGNYIGSQQTGKPRVQIRVKLFFKSQ